MSGQPAAGGGRWVIVHPERLAGWLAGFADRHGSPTSVATPTAVVFTAADGTVADCRVPFPPLRVDPAAPDGGLAAHATLDRRVGVLLVRLGGYAIGVFQGDTLLVSKVGSRPVHGRSAAGGWSQHRFARRREGQVRTALAAAADAAAAVFGPAAAKLDAPKLDALRLDARKLNALELDAVVVGGDRRAVDAVLADPRLAALRPLVVGPPLDGPDPRRSVLERTPRRFRAIRIRVVDS